MATRHHGEEKKFFYTRKLKLQIQYLKQNNTVACLVQVLNADCTWNYILHKTIFWLPKSSETQTEEIKDENCQSVCLKGNFGIF